MMGWHKIFKKADDGDEFAFLVNVSLTRQLTAKTSSFVGNCAGFPQSWDQSMFQFYCGTQVMITMLCDAPTACLCERLWAVV